MISGGDNPYDVHDAKLSSSATAHESSSVTAHEISNICIPYNLDIVLLLFCVMLSPCIFVLFILPSDFALGQKRITDQLI